MFKLLKTLFSYDNEVNNDPFFDKVSQETAISHKIPIEKLAEAIRSNEDVWTFASHNHNRAEFKIKKEDGRYFCFNVQIQMWNYLTCPTTYLSKKVTMRSGKKSSAKDECLKSKCSENKEFELTEEEATYLIQVIKVRHDSDERKQQKNARQAVENALSNI
jgi:hypothetical protein